MDLIESVVEVSYNDGFAPVVKKSMDAPLFFYEIEQAFSINTDSLCVMVNDIVLEECNENTTFVSGDKVQVFRILNGGARTKKTLGTIVQIASAVAAIALSAISAGSATPGVYAAYSAAVSITGTILSTYLLRRAAKLAQGQEGQIETNIFSVVSARNQARQLEYLPLPVGEVRFSPDYTATPYSKYLYGINGTLFYAGVTPPASRFSTFLYPSNFTRARIIIADPPSVIPSGVVYNQGLEAIFSGTNVNITGVSGSLLSSTNRREVFVHNFFRDAVGAGVDANILLINRWTGPLGVVTNKNIIIVVTGSIFTTFTLSTLKTSCKIYAPSNLTPLELAHLQSNFPSAVFQTWNTGGNISSTNVAYWNYKTNAMSQTYPILYVSDTQDDHTVAGQTLIGRPLGYWAVTNPPYSTVVGFGKSLVANLGSVYGSFSEENGNGVLYAQPYGPINGATVIQNAPTFQNNVAAYTAVTPRQMLIHSFCFGLGDLFIDDRRLENTPLLQLSNTYYSQTAKGFLFDEGWSINAIIIPETGEFHAPSESVKVFEGGELLSSDNIAYPDNAIIRDLPEDTTRVEVDIEGQLLKSDGSGYVDLISTIACYVEDKTTNARIYLSFYNDGGLFPPLTDNFTLIGNNKQQIRVTISSYLSGVFLFPNHRIVVYKMTPDPTDTESVERLSVTNIKAFRQVTYAPNPFDWVKHYAENREGLLIMSTNKSEPARTYNARVRAKIWKYNPLADDYTWDFSSNPADVFLTMALGYFATGLNHTGATFPTAPTLGFTTGPQASSVYRIAGLGYDLDKIDLVSIKRWWVFCNDKSLNFNHVFLGEETGMSALSLIAARGRGSVDFYRTGKLGVIWEEETPVEFVFGMSNIELDSFNIQYALGQLPYKIKGTFQNKEKDYEADFVEFQVPYAETDSLNILEVPLIGITSKDEAEREIKIACYRTWYNRKTYTFTTGQEGAQLSRGTRIYVSHDILNHLYTDRVHCFTINEDTNEVLTVSIDMMAEMPAPINTLQRAIVRYVDNTIETFEVSVDDNGLVSFIGALKPNATLFPHYMNDNGQENPLSIATGTVQEDVIIHLGQIGNLGQLAKIIEVQPQDDRTDDGQATAFTIRAIPDDPILYSAEYDYTPFPLPMADSYELITSRIENVETTQNGEIVTFWVDGLNCTGFRVETQSGIPLLLNGGSQSVASTNFYIEMLPGTYDLRIIPYVTGIIYQSIPYEFTLEVV